MRSPLGALARAVRSVRNLGPPPMTSARAGTAAGMFAGRRGEAPLSMMEAVSTVFSVVSRLANSTARVDWTLYRTAASGLDDDRVPVASHAVIDLWNTPNAFMGRQDAVEVGQQHLELAGKACLVVARSAQYGRGTRAGDLPLELWPVRPDRIAAVPDPRKFQIGWVYTSPDGEEIPLRLDEVLCLKTPNPRDPYDGLSPVQSLMTDLDSARYSAQWNRNFFVNGAQPGGIISVEGRLSDDEYDEMAMRWREQHQGVANAHRVAILEAATYTESKITQRDMQFVELRNVSRDMIREAWGIPKFALGDIDDVNRATAEASSDWFGRELSTPRLERWKSMLNTRLLPMYGATTRGLEYDFAPVVSKDQTAENEDLAARVSIAQDLYALGVQWADALRTAGLPPMPQRIEITAPAPDDQSSSTDIRDTADRALVEALQKMYLAVEGNTFLTKREGRELANRFGAGLDPDLDPITAPDGQQPPGGPGSEGTPAQGGLPPASPTVPAAPPGAPVDAPATAAQTTRRVTELLDEVRGRARNADDPPDDPAAAESVDLGPVQSAWEAALTTLLEVWGASVVAGWVTDLVGQVADVVRGGTLLALADLDVDIDDAVTRVMDAMHQLSDTAAHHVVEEARAQDTEVKPATPAREVFRGQATVTVQLLADGLEISAAREAQRVAGPDADPDVVAEQVQTHLESLTDAEPAKQLGAALTTAQNTGRVETLRRAPSGAIYASEVLDTNTCLCPDALVTTRRGEIRADEVTLADELLTHTGQWVAPSQITISEVDEDVVVAYLGNGRRLRVTADHPVLVDEGDALVWREADEVTAGSFMVSQTTLENGGELVVPDLVLGQTPHDVAPVGEVSGLTPVDVRAQRVPVAAVSFDHQPLADEEIRDPRANLGLGGEDQTLTLQALADDAFDAGLQTARKVAARRTVAAVLRAGRDGPERGAALLAGDEDRGTAAGLAAVPPGLGAAVAEHRATAPTGGVTSACGGGAGTRAVVEAGGVGHGDVECSPAARACLGDAVLPAAELGAQVGVGELAGDRAVGGAGLTAAGDLATAHLAVAGREPLAPTLTGGVGATSRPGGDPNPTVDTRSVHTLNVVRVVAVERQPHRGYVYDFTVPGDQTFWTEGVLVHNCSPCRAVHGRWICNTEDLTPLHKLYPVGGYVDCLGGNRCRGTVVGNWRPKTVGEGEN